VSPTWSALRPRPWSRPGAFFVRVLMAASLAACASPVLLSAQAPDTIPPPPPDTVPPVPDTIPPPPPPPDTVPPVPDTIPPPPPDTIPVAADTVPVDTVPPEPPPDPPALPPLRPVGPTGWATGVWQWERADLLRLPDLSLLHLLERVPGITTVRVTPVGQPEGVAVFGAAAGAVRYEMDGFVLDPLTAPTFDPSRLPLLALESVRVERRVTGAIVRIRTASPVDPRSYTVIEAGTGDLRTNLFRGTFLGPNVLGGGLALGFESLGSQTLAGGTSSHLAGWLKWTWAGDDSGIQLEYRQSDMTREGVAAGLVGSRRDWVVRARRRFGPVTAEGYAGASSVEDDLGEIVLREGTPQGGLRLRSDLSAPVPIEATAAIRLRAHPRLPAQELEVAGWAYPTPWLALGAQVDHARWEDRSPTGQLAVSARAGPVVGVSATAGVFRATHLLAEAGVDPGLPGTGVAGIDVTREGARVGLELQRGAWLVAAAAVGASVAPATGFGLPFDEAGAAFSGGRSNGVEAAVRLPTLWQPLRLHGWYVGMDVPAGWPYFPTEQWSAALVYHDVPLPSGNLELYARAEHAVRGGMAVPAAEELARVGAYRATNLELTIRVMTVRAFLRWQNVFNRPFQEDVPGFQRPGQHVMYGVKWEFWN
jgi:hypothetical protein